MSDERDPGEMPQRPPVMFREYIFRAPQPFADVLEKMRGLQQQLEDREIENSEYFCWLLMLGVHEVNRLNAIAEKSESRIISSGPGFSLPKDGVVFP